MLDKLLPADRDKDADADMRAAHGTLLHHVWPRLGRCQVRRTCCGMLKQQELAVVLASSADEPEFNALRGPLITEET